MDRSCQSSLPGVIPNKVYPPFKFHAHPHESYDQFRNQFLDFCEQQQYSEVECRRALRHCMAGKALERVVLLDHDCSFHALMTKYDVMFMEMTDCLLARVNFDGAKQGQGETMKEFYDRVLFLFETGYPDYPLGSVLIEQFINGLYSSSLREHMKKAQPLSWVEILAAAELKQKAIDQEAYYYSVVTRKITERNLAIEAHTRQLLQAGCVGGSMEVEVVVPPAAAPVPPQAEGQAVSRDPPNNIFMEELLPGPSWRSGPPPTIAFYGPFEGILKTLDSPTKILKTRGEKRKNSGKNEESSPSKKPPQDF